MEQRKLARALEAHLVRVRVGVRLGVRVRVKARLGVRDRAHKAHLVRAVGPRRAEDHLLAQQHDGGSVGREAQHDQVRVEPVDAVAARQLAGGADVLHDLMLALARHLI